MVVDLKRSAYTRLTRRLSLRDVNRGHQMQGGRIKGKTSERKTRNQQKENQALTRGRRIGRFCFSATFLIGLGRL